MEYHVTSALKGEATRQQVIEATAVVLVLGGGLAQWPARLVFKVLDEVERENAEEGEPEAATDAP